MNEKIIDKLFTTEMRLSTNPNEEYVKYRFLGIPFLYLKFNWLRKIFGENLKK